MWEEGEFTRNMMKHSEENFRREAERRRAEEEEKDRHRSSNSQGGGGVSDSRGWGILILLGIVGFILFKIYMFIKANWVSIVTILGICVMCVIACIIIHIKAKKTGLKKLLTILAAAGLICIVLFSGPRKTEAFFVNLVQWIPGFKQKTINEATSMYTYVISDTLNIRAGPSVDSEIVGQLLKGQSVEIIDKSEQWWKIKYEKFEGYVDSDFLWH